MCVENTRSDSKLSKPVSVPPRGRLKDKYDFRFYAESSPHARGTLLYAVYAVVLAGIIPACAGNTGTFGQSVTSGRDHPRMRGEHHFRTLSPPEPPGSSPHARGTRIR